MEDQPQESPKTASSIATNIGAVALDPLRTDLMRSSLTYFIERQSPVNLPDFNTIVNHDEYTTARQGLVRSAMLAAVAGSNTLEHFIGELETLQKGYARQVIIGIVKGVKDQKEYLEMAEEEVRRGEQIEIAYAEIGKKRAADLSIEDFERVKSLRAKVDELNKTKEQIKETRLGLEGVFRVEQTLTTLIDSGVDCIHYIVPSVKEAQERLGTNTYDGPIFDPFRVTNTVSISDMFMRSVSMPIALTNRVSGKKGINLELLPPILQDIVKMYNHVRGLPLGNKIIPKHIKEQLKLSLSSRAIGSYLENSEELCGVKMEDNNTPYRTFVRQESGTQSNVEVFIKHIVENMVGDELNAVNSHQYGKALMFLRDTDEGYSGFTSETVSKLADSQGLLVSRMYIAKNLGNDPEVVCIRERKFTVPAQFKFKTVVPTPTQIKYSEEAVRDFGVNRFGPREIVDTIISRHPDYKISRRVVEEVLGRNLDSLGLRIASDTPLQYQKKVEQTTRETLSVPTGTIM